MKIAIYRTTTCTTTRGLILQIHSDILDHIRCTTLESFFLLCIRRAAYDHYFQQNLFPRIKCSSKIAALPKASVAKHGAQPLGTITTMHHLPVSPRSQRPPPTSSHAWSSPPCTRSRTASSRAELKRCLDSASGKL